jgi:two-component system NtrC family sensor kinase
LIGIKEISLGNLNHKVFSSSSDEIGTLGKSFNKMTGDLQVAKKEITEWSDELERKVEEKTEELQKTQDRILQIEKMASLGKLSATVAHELNNPMAGILTYSKLIQRKLKKDSLPENEKNIILKQLHMIESESDRLGKIIKDLLLFSKKQEPEFKDVDLNEVVEMSFLLIKHHLDLHNITLEKILQPNLPLVQVDENQIKQMLLALYVNAAEAIGNDGVLKVSTFYKESEKKVYLSIQDNGKGIPEEVKPHIFEPFFTTKNAVKGFGLGLSVVYGIVENHRAEITVDSQVNSGTTFAIKFPVKNQK